MIPNFIPEAQIELQNLLKISHYFSKLLSFQANFGNTCIKWIKLGLF